jgi:hypothetical protein
MLGLIPGVIAMNKGRSFFGWWIYGALLFIIALPHALLMRSDVKAMERRELETGENRKCPFCAEIVKAEAKICKHCGKDLPAFVPGPRFDPDTGAAI